MDRKGIHPGVIFGAIVAIIAIIAGGVYWLRREPPAPAELAAPAPRSLPSEADGDSPSPPQELLPPIDASDPLVRTVVRELSSHPRLLTWIASDQGLVRTFVAAVEQIAEGKSPREQLAAFTPPQGFEAAVDDTAGGMVAAPRTSARYDVVVDILTAVDSDSAGLAYQRLRPLFAEAYREIGRQGSDFDETLARAIDELMAVPAVDRPVLEATVEGYRYRDPGLEALSPAQKHLLRTGAANVRRVQAKLAELRAALDLPR